MSSTVGELDHTIIGFQWKINNFCNINKKAGECMYSPTFKITLENKIFTGCLKLYPYGKEEGCKDFISLRFQHNAPFESSVLVELIQVSLMCKNGILCQRKLMKIPFKKGRFFHFDKFIKRKDLLDTTNCAFLGKALVIKLEFIFSSTPGIQTADPLKNTNFSANPVNISKQDYKSKCHDDLEQLLDEEKYSDLKFIVKDKTILAHKVILVTRSQYFKRMFEHQMKESKDGIVEITDVSYQVMYELLRYMYSTRVNDIEKIAWDLLAAANKYCMDDLKSLCEDSLFSTLNADNAVEYLVMTNSCNTIQLRTLIIQFINDHPDVIETAAFKELNSDVMYEVVRAMARKRVKK